MCSSSPIGALHSLSTLRRLGYFYDECDISMIGFHVEFIDGGDELGHAIGLFRVGLNPLALGHYLTVKSSVMMGLCI